MSKVKVEIRCGDRFAGEYVNLDEERKHFDECAHQITFEYWTRPITAIEIGKLLGNHFVFGYLESLFQSDHSPSFFLEENNNFDWVVTVEKVVVVHT